MYLLEFLDRFLTCECLWEAKMSHVLKPVESAAKKTFEAQEVWGAVLALNL